MRRKYFLLKLILGLITFHAIQARAQVCSGVFSAAVAKPKVTELRKVLNGMTGTYTGAGLNSQGEKIDVRIQIEQNKFFPNLFRVVFFEDVHIARFPEQEENILIAPDGSELRFDEPHISGAKVFIVDLNDLKSAALGKRAIEIERSTQASGTRDSFNHDKLQINVDEHGRPSSMHFYQTMTGGPFKDVLYRLSIAVDKPKLTTARRLWLYQDFFTQSDYSLEWPTQTRIHSETVH